MTGTTPEHVREQQARDDGSRVAQTLEDIAPEPVPERPESAEERPGPPDNAENQLCQLITDLTGEGSPATVGN